jgi:hypothetical protein
MSLRSLKHFFMAKDISIYISRSIFIVIDYNRQEVKIGRLCGHICLVSHCGESAGLSEVPLIYSKIYLPIG